MYSAQEPPRVIAPAPPRILQETSPFYMYKGILSRSGTPRILDEDPGLKNLLSVSQADVEHRSEDEIMDSVIGNGAREILNQENVLYDQEIVDSSMRWSKELFPLSHPGITFSRFATLSEKLRIKPTAEKLLANFQYEDAVGTAVRDYFDYYIRDLDIDDQSLRIILPEFYALEETLHRYMGITVYAWLFNELVVHMKVGVEDFSGDFTFLAFYSKRRRVFKEIERLQKSTEELPRRVRETFDRFESMKFYLFVRYMRMLGGDSYFTPYSGDVLQYLDDWLVTKSPKAPVSHPFIEMLPLNVHKIRDMNSMRVKYMVDYSTQILRDQKHPLSMVEHTATVALRIEHPDQFELNPILLSHPANLVFLLHHLVINDAQKELPKSLKEKLQIDRLIEAALRNTGREGFSVTIRQEGKVRNNVRFNVYEAGLYMARKKANMTWNSETSRYEHQRVKGARKKQLTETEMLTTNLVNLDRYVRKDILAFLPKQYWDWPEADAIINYAKTCRDELRRPRNVSDPDSDATELPDE